MQIYYMSVILLLCVCVCVGVDSMAHYEQALRQVRYRNGRPASLNERKFRLTCSELNGRYTSNEFNLEVSLAASYFNFLLSLSVLHCLILFLSSINHLCLPALFHFPLLSLHPSLNNYQSFKCLFRLLLLH